eukprot:TRINITY_DN5580_c0_g1_i8.p1 TRINITY_DN5580_c0_g1~~TRINITY_DN5580_c0_g1_i8.p1  ORF type:complete len:105 (-),score=8.94 TRINITY_DN5580_c0_g1_i8:454-768(-)
MHSPSFGKNFTSCFLFSSFCRKTISEYEAHSQLVFPIFPLMVYTFSSLVNLWALWGWAGLVGPLPSGLKHLAAPSVTTQDQRSQVPNTNTIQTSLIWQQTVRSS